VSEFDEITPRDFDMAHEHVPEDRKGKLPMKLEGPIVELVREAHGLAEMANKKMGILHEEIMKKKKVIWDKIKEEGGFDEDAFEAHMTIDDSCIDLGFIIIKELKKPEPPDFLNLLKGLLGDDE
jgi:hypothetical protein